MSSVAFVDTGQPAAGPEVAVNLSNMHSTLEAIGERARSGEGFTLFTINLDHVVKLNENDAFREAYGRANFVTADGWPVVWLIDQEGSGLERTTGADLLEPMCRQASEMGYSVYFVGPGPESQRKGLGILTTRYPGLKVAGAEAPQLPSTLDDALVDAMAGRITASGARICVLSLGAPKQELLADALHQRCPNVGFLCIGAALDFISGHASRAPDWVKRAKLEWCWRLVHDPMRLTLRYANCAFALVKLALPGIFRRGPRLKLADPK
ncbi:MAG TPA: WecB/TagA/CpsF family glycosyltransferase [Beijerinckiaceae bacterium]|nr:WecB/TagA/CpsF family glycosyltransferase [Beijerinckiaceae bacterium]